MKNMKKISLSLFSCAFYLCFLAPLCAELATLKGKINGLKSNVAALNAALGNVGTSLGALKGKLSGMSASLTPAPVASVVTGVPNPAPAGPPLPPQKKAQGPPTVESSQQYLKAKKQDRDINRAVREENAKSKQLEFEKQELAKEKSANPQGRGMLIFLNSGHQKVLALGAKDPILEGLVSALSCEATDTGLPGVIVASVSLLFNVREFGLLNGFHIKKINDNLYLLVSKKYLAAMQIPAEKFLGFIERDARKPGSRPTDIELRLGLKVNHMHTAQTADIEKFKQNLTLASGDNADYFVELLNEKGDKKSEIFCTKKDYAQKDSNNSHEVHAQTPDWSFYLYGHGGKGIVAEIQIDAFKEMLQFLEKKINTKLFIYASCHAAGMNAEAIYGIESDIYKPLPTEDVHSEASRIPTYSYAIITSTLTDTVTYIYNINFKSFLIEVTQPKIDYEKVNYLLTIDAMDNYLKIAVPDMTMSRATVINALRVESALKIRLPHTEWFSVVDYGDDTVAIGLILAE